MIRINLTNYSYAPRLLEMPEFLYVDLNGLPTIFIWEFMAVCPWAEAMRQMKGFVAGGNRVGLICLDGLLAGWTSGYLDLMAFVVRRVVIKFKICTRV